MDNEQGAGNDSGRRPWQEDGLNQHYRNISRVVRNRPTDEALAGDIDDFKAGVTSW